MERNRISNIIFYSVLVLTLIAFGWLRDGFLAQYNAYLYELYYHDSEYILPQSMSYLSQFTYMELYNAKFYIIAFFCVFNLGISLMAINYIFRNKLFLKITAGFYIAILLTSGIFYLYGMMLHGSDKVYEIARSFLAWVQSPLILMILIPAFKISEKEKIQIQ